MFQSNVWSPYRRLRYSHVVSGTNFFSFADWKILCCCIMKIDHNTNQRISTITFFVNLTVVLTSRNLQVHVCMHGIKANLDGPSRTETLENDSLTVHNSINMLFIHNIDSDISVKKCLLKFLSTSRSSKCKESIII